MRRGRRTRLCLFAIFTGLGMIQTHGSVSRCRFFADNLFTPFCLKRISQRRYIDTFAFHGGLAFTATSPWYARAWYHAGNPVWPIANEIFRGAFYGSSFSITKAKFPEASGLSWARLSDQVYLSGSFLVGVDWNEQMGWQRAIGIYYVALCPIASSLLAFARHPLVDSVQCIILFTYSLGIDGNPRYNLAFLRTSERIGGVGGSPNRIINGAVFSKHI